MESGLRLICQNFIPMGPRFVQSKLGPTPYNFEKRKSKFSCLVHLGTSGGRELDSL